MASNSLGLNSKIEFPNCLIEKNFKKVRNKCLFWKVLIEKKVGYFIYIIEVILNCSLILLNVVFIPNVADNVLKIKSKKYTASLLYIFLHASVVTFLLGFNANFAKTYVFVVTILNIIISLFLYYKSNENFLEYYFFKNKEYFKYTIISTLIISIYTIYSVRINFLYNGHDPYLFGIPFETLSASYNSRLKVFDNYPFVWTKFHFFNGAVSSIILAPIFIKNIFIYKFSKLIILTLSLLSISEFVKFTKNQIILLSILFVVFSSQFAWIYYTNGFLSLYLFIIFLLLIVKKDYLHPPENQFILILVLALFSLSTIRSLVPGVSVLLFILFRKYISIRQLGVVKFSILSLVFISLLSMVLLGQNQISNSTIQFNYKNYFSMGWNNLFLIRNILLSFKLFIIEHTIPFFIKLFWAVAVITLIILNLSSLKLFKWREFYSTKFITILYFLINGFSIIFYSNKYLYSLSFLSIFLFPLYLVISQNTFEKRTNYILFCFILVSIIQILIIDPSSSIPNAILFDYIILLYLFLKFQFAKLNLNSIIALVVIISPLFYLQNMIIPPISDRTSKKVKVEKLINEKISDLESDFIYKTAIKGSRYNYNKLIGDSISVSQNFILRSKF